MAPHTYHAKEPREHTAVSVCVRKTKIKKNQRGKHTERERAVNLLFKQEGQPFGSCVIELLRDLVPATAQHFVRGCTERFEGGKFRCVCVHVFVCAQTCRLSTA
jgi:hypothetical protein